MIFKSTTLFVLLAFFTLQVDSQTSNDFIIIDEIAENYEDVEDQIIDQNNIYHTKGIQVVAFEQISEAIEGQQVQELHIYVPTKPGALVFSNQTLTAENVAKFAPEISKWRNSVSQQVVIHSEVVFSGEEGVLFKQLLEGSTGLIFKALK